MDIERAIRNKINFKSTNNFNDKNNKFKKKRIIWGNVNPRKRYEKKYYIKELRRVRDDEGLQ